MSATGQATVLVRGSGSIGQRHARVFAALGARVLLWPVRPRPALGVDAATGAHLLDDAAGPAALAEADLVVVATDTSRHVADTVAALDAGAMKVLLEKPVAPSLAAARALADHDRAGAVWVAAPLRAQAGFLRVLDLLPDLGTDLSAHVWSQSWLPDWRPGRDYRQSYSARADEGGVLRDLVHELDYLAVLFGRPRVVGAVLDHTGPLEMAAEQAATLLLSSPWAPAVTVRLDYTTRPTSRGIVVRGPRGSLSWDVVAATVTRVGVDGTALTESVEGDRDRDATMAVQARAALALDPTDDSPDAHAAGAPATLADGLATLELCDAARVMSERNERTTHD